MLRAILVLLLLASLTGTAVAKDVCVTTTAFGPLTYVLRGVKTPKPGKFAPVHGLAAVSFPRVNPALIQGTVYGQSDGRLRFELLVQGLLAQGFTTHYRFSSASIDRKLFTGTDLGVLPDGTNQNGTWTPFDCKTLTIP